jgi:hypothetical protein
MNAPSPRARHLRQRFSPPVAWVLLGLPSLLGCATDHAGRARSDAAWTAADDDDGSAAQDASATETGAEIAAADAGSEAAVAEPAPNLACRLCINGTRQPRFYVLDRDQHTCTVLHLGWSGACAGFNLGMAEVCLEAAELWSGVETCPPGPGTPSFPAESARGSVVGHEGILGIDVELSFAAGAPLASIAVDFDDCRHDYEDLKPPCP